MDIFRKEAVRSHDDIDPALFEAQYRLFLFLSRLEPRERFDDDGVTGLAGLEGAEVLRCEDRGRAEQRHLLAAHGHTKCCAQRDFGFPEADVATHEAVHGPR